MESKKFKSGVFSLGKCLVFVAIENGLWHLSISRKDRSPNYEEIKEARYKFIPDEVYMAQIFPPKKEFVNVMPFCHHLWEIRHDTE